MNCVLSPKHDNLLIVPLSTCPKVVRALLVSILCLTIAQTLANDIPAEGLGDSQPQPMVPKVHKKRPKTALPEANSKHSDEDDSTADVISVQKTRFGDVSLVSIDAMPADTILLNGKKVFEDSGMYVGIYGYFQSSDSDVMLIGSNPGGSATPETTMSFLIITRDGQAHTVSDPDFIAVSQGDVAGHIDNKGRIWVRLGFAGGAERVAELDSGKVTLHLIRKKVRSLDSTACQSLYAVGASICPSEFSHQNGCGEFVADAGEKGVIGSGAEMGTFNYYSNWPGFNRKGFSNTCLAWCKGMNFSYGAFSKAVCVAPHDR